MKAIKQVKNYRLLREIGKGQMGTVYEAVDESNGNKFAIKSIPSSKLENKQILENIQKELKLIQGLSHINVIKILGYKKTINNTYLVLEYCNGSNLNEYLKYFHHDLKKSIPESHIQFFIRQLIQGIDYMMKNKLFQRDLKLENIMINFSSGSNCFPNNQGNFKIDQSKFDIFNSIIKITDISYTKELEGYKIYSTKFGQSFIDANNKTLFDLNDRIDLWSLGSITYELLLGSKPHDKIKNDKCFMNDKICLSLEIASFINRLLNFKVENRFSWENIISHPFIVNNISTFNYIELEKTNIIECGLHKKGKSEFHNLLWIDYKTDLIYGSIDKIMDNKVRNDEKPYRNLHIENIKSPNKKIYSQKGDVRLHINSQLETDNHKINQSSSNINNKIEDRIDEKLIKPKEYPSHSKIFQNKNLKYNNDVLKKETELLENDLSELNKCFDWSYKTKEISKVSTQINVGINNNKKEIHIDLDDKNMTSVINVHSNFEFKNEKMKNFNEDNSFIISKNIKNLDNSSLIQKSSINDDNYTKFDDFGSVLNDLLNKDIDSTKNEIAYDKASNFLKNDNNSVISNNSIDNLWEIISTKSLENGIIEVKGTFCDNIIKLDYFN